MIPIVPTAAILTAAPNENANQPRWTFLFDNISTRASTKLNFLGLALMVIGLVAIGCEAYLLKTGNVSSNTGRQYYDLFGIHVFAFGFLVLLLYRHQVYVMIAVFLLSFYEFLSLIRVIILYSISLAVMTEECNAHPLSDCVTVTIRALFITCLICALLAFGLIWENLIVTSREFQLSMKSPMAAPPMAVAYINQAHVADT
ncbi:unnamed protein product [Adineta ricciae]|uniref:Uncharacterized protein n=1 Tax=Adineta ricciae TaxID=249248 RepID=A0A814A7H7_ADIRI|nr:unnamed protein product [Adineta ricciae]CAF0971780.1 unnamed protein product [Adineta ricciae]